MHDVAWSLTDALGRRRPDLEFDTTAVLFGAATHDIGKVVHVEELSAPGHAHEEAGRDLLLRYGVLRRTWRVSRAATRPGTTRTSPSTTCW
nr:hypothetical protein GCM10020092_018500 [Actinoplanes digitatis]